MASESFLLIISISALSSLFGAILVAESSDEQSLRSSPVRAVSTSRRAFVEIDALSSHIPITF